MSPRVTDEEPDAETLRALHRAIAGVHSDYAALHYNTAAAKLIELNNHLTKAYGATGVPRAVAEPLVLMMAPLTPHVAEELWSLLGHEGSLAHGPFPVADERYLVAETVEYPIQVNGKVRSRVTVAADADTDQVKAAALADEKVVAALARRGAAQADRGAGPSGQRGGVGRVSPSVSSPRVRETAPQMAIMSVEPEPLAPGVGGLVGMGVRIPQAAAPVR